VVEQKIAVLFTEHSMDVVFAHADRMIVLARGRLIAQGTSEDIRKDAKVQEVYFGTGATFENETAVPDVHANTALSAPGLAVPLLSVQSLCAWYGAAQILYDVNFQVKRGEVVALMGRNGAGKSTTMKALMGLLEKRTGDVHFMKRDISKDAAHRIAASGLGYVPEDRRIFTDLTVLENLEVGRQKSRVWPDGAAAPTWTVQQLFTLFPNLGEMPKRPGGQMSGGEQQMLTVARSLMGNPYLVLLDEPSEGVAPVIVEQMAQMILALKKQGVSILLSEQNLHFARLVCDRAYVLEKGQIRFGGTMAELDADEHVRQTYLSV